MSKTLESGEIDALVCGPCTLPANAINEMSADALCKECQAKLRQVADAAASKAARLAREDALKEVVKEADSIANTVLVGNSRLNLYQQLFERLRYEYERKAANSRLPASLREGKKEGKG